MSKPIGSFFLEQGALSEAQVAQTWEWAKSHDRRFEEAILALKLLDEATLMPLLSEYWAIPWIDLSQYLVDPMIARLIPRHICSRHQVLALNRVGLRLTVAMVNPVDVVAIDDLQLITGLTVKPMLTTPSALAQALSEAFPED
jgi:type IV pilus assembly protein PilB